jgi:subtilisin family serine protease
MKRVLHLSLIAITSQICFASAIDGNPLLDKRSDAIYRSDMEPYAAGRLILKFDRSYIPSLSVGEALDGSRFPALKRVNLDNGLKDFRPLIANDAFNDSSLRDYDLDLYYIVEFEVQDPALVSKSYLDLPMITDVDLDWLQTKSTIPNDSYFNGQWAHRNTGQAQAFGGGSVGTYDCDIDSEQAWDISTGSSSIIVAIIDTGVDSNHPDLAAKLVSGWDYVNSDSDPEDDEGHGTACAGLAAAISNNGTGMTGVDWNAQIMPLKALDSDGSGWSSDIISCINYARTHGANVISMSLGGGNYSSSYNSALLSAYNSGIVNVAAAGNDDVGTVSYPAKYSSVMAVGALSPCNNRKSPSTCDGEYWWGSNWGNELEVMSPGTRLRATEIGGGYMADMNGTSGATPIVAGVASLIMSVNNSLSAAEIRAIIQNSAVDLGSAGWDSDTGYGRLNAYQALLDTPGIDPCITDYDAPEIIHTPLESTTETGPFQIVAIITDDCGLDIVSMRYRVNGGGWNSITLSVLGDQYTGNIPSQISGSTIDYEISATDDSPNSNVQIDSQSFQIIDGCVIDFTVPAISYFSQPVDSYDETGPYLIVLNITDPCGVSNVQLNYSVNGGGSNVGMIIESSADVWVGTIPGQISGSAIIYTILAFDASPQFNMAIEGGIFNILDACDSDLTPPVISHAPLLADTYDTTGPYTVLADVSDPCGLAAVGLEYRLNTGSWSSLGFTNIAGDTWSGEIPGQPSGTLVEYRINATDGSSNANASTSSFSFTILSAPITPNLSIITLSSEEIELSWDEVVGASGYRVYVSTAGAGFVLLTETGALSLNVTVSPQQVKLFKVVSFITE